MINKAPKTDKIVRDNAFRADAQNQYALILVKHAVDLETDSGVKQTHIDSLMLEYCPDEMTPEQIVEWSRNQRKAPLEKQAIDAALQVEEKRAMSEFKKAGPLFIRNDDSEMIRVEIVNGCLCMGGEFDFTYSEALALHDWLDGALGKAPEGIRLVLVEPRPVFIGKSVV